MRFTHKIEFSEFQELCQIYKSPFFLPFLPFVGQIIYVISHRIAMCLAAFSFGYIRLLKYLKHPPGNQQAFGAIRFFVGDVAVLLGFGEQGEVNVRIYYSFTPRTER